MTEVIQGGPINESYLKKVSLKPVEGQSLTDAYHTYPPSVGKILAEAQKKGGEKWALPK